MHQSVLKNKVIWITGASSGIGEALATLAAQQGATVILSARSVSKLSTLQQQLSAFSTVYVVECDVSSEKSIQSAKQALTKITPHIDVLINNAGIGRFGNFCDLTTQDFDDVFSTNIKGQFMCTQVVLPTMIERNSGTIVNILSVAAVKTFTLSSIYGASKAAGLLMSRSIRQEMRERKINVQVIDILPGATRTPIWGEENLQKLGDGMMDATSVAEATLQAVSLSVANKMMVEEIVLRPQGGDV
jgi:3-oxoacyl-[acyl-carrier protein] reductase